ncbi:hypothetical protein QQS21_011928 [Conoideocrella luteorostrata]|uniref:Sulfotransferase n=1 Tax=Conoideocrella luteorostrata TaxID=1105319 RepID=A0AAJ0CGQ2_9HYPO|nr:hypothetical protein QQS21_011928 [Conoideocrella luteorostrata]
MSAALEKLGIPCWHSFQLFSAHYGDNEMWLDILTRKFFSDEPYEPVGREELDQLLHSFGAVSSDPPAICFAEELIAAYPEAKIVLVERDIDSWYESYMHSIVRNICDPFANLVLTLERSYFRPIGIVQKRALEGWAGIRSYKEGELKAKDNYRKHYASIRRVTPKSRLLEFSLQDGWEPLCEFLGKPVPEEEFPHLNEKAWFDEKVKLLLRRGIKNAARAVFPWIFALVVITAAFWVANPNTKYGKTSS